MDVRLNAFSRLGNGSIEDGDPGLLSEKTQARSSTNVRRIGWYLLPSFIARHYGHSDVEIPKPHATSYLNGVRGLAATIVVIFHAASEWFYYMNFAFTVPPNNRLIQMPFVRVLFSGQWMVCIFFVLSGFVLSYGPLKKAHADNALAAIAGVPGSVVRRPIRLFMPALPILLVTAIATYLQIIYWMEFSVDLKPSTGSLFSDVFNVLQEWFALISPWQALNAKSYQPPSNPVLWTLGTEFQGSLIIFIMTLALARISPWLRITVVTICALDAFFFNPGRYPIFLFLAGMVLADMRHIRAKLPELPRQIRLAVKVGSYILLILALFFGGFPNYIADKGMWYSYFTTWPTKVFGQEDQGRDFFWLALAGVMLIAALENLPELHGFFNLPVILYLGEVSYALYLVHWLFVHTVGRGLIFGLRKRGVSESASAVFAIAMAMATSFWAADVYWRLVDLNSIKFARYVAEKMGV
jgi:peptidoglycan/LPS O-acetylase OafA/YrhL